MASKPKEIEWRVDKKTHVKFWGMVRQYIELPEDSEEAEALLEDIRALPGFPRHTRLTGRGAPVVNVVLTTAGDVGLI